MTNLMTKMMLFVWVTATVAGACAAQKAPAPLEVDKNPLVYNIPGAHLGETCAASGKKITLGIGTQAEVDESRAKRGNLLAPDGHDVLLAGTDPATDTVSFTVDLGAPRDLCSISVMTFDPTRQGNWDGKGSLLVSHDGKEFTLLADKLSGNQLISKIWEEGKGFTGFVYTYTNGGTVVITGSLDGVFVAKQVRYVRFQAINPGKQGWKVGGIEVRTDPGLVIPMADKPVTFDADLSAWKNVPGMKLDRSWQVKTGHWAGPGQLSGVVRVMADAQNLYVAADVTKHGAADNDLRGDKATAKDCVELFLELRDLKNASSDFNAFLPASARPESGYEYQLLLNPGNAKTPPQIWFAGRDSGMGRLEIKRIRGTNNAAAVDGKIEVFNKPDGNGYVIGAVIPMRNFGNATLAPGMQIGLDAAIDAAAAGQEDSLRLVYYAGKNASYTSSEWGRAFFQNADRTRAAGKKSVITVDADIARSFDGQDQIVRETFGMEAYPSGMNTHMLEKWNSVSGCFGRVYFGGWKFPGLDGKSEAEKRALIFNPDYWKTVDMRQVTPDWAALERMAKAKPKHLFMLLWTRAGQFAGDPAFGGKPASLTPEREKLLKGTPFEGLIKGFVNAAGPEDQTVSLNRDKELYAEIVANVIAKLKEIFPQETSISVTTSNENNWINMFWNKPILDDFFTTLEKYGEYDAGCVAANEWVKYHNAIYRAIKKRFPEVLVGGPDVCAVNFTDVVGGRSRWNDYIAPVLDNVAGLDFFDYHYGVNQKSCQIIMETVNQYARQRRGWTTLRSVDSEAGPMAFDRSPFAFNQFKNGLLNQREWFGWLRNPEMTYGWAPIDFMLYYDGFGRGRGAGMAITMFETLRGRYLQAGSDTLGLETVAAMDGGRVACVALNDRGEWRETEFKISAPDNAAFKELRARLLWFDFKAEKIQHATFKPVPVKGADGLTVTVKLPPFATCALDGVLGQAASPGRINAQQRFIGDRVVFWVAPEKSQTLKIDLPTAALSGKKRYTLRIGYEKNTAGSAVVSVNGKLETVLPAPVKTDGWDRFGLVELELDRAVLKPANEIVFSAKPGGGKYAVIMGSVLVQDNVKARVSGNRTVTVNLDPASECVITEEESKTMPAWYFNQISAGQAEMPPLRARWSFDDATDGLVPDLSGNGNGCRLLNGAVLGIGMKGHALQLNGQGAGAKVEDSPFLHIGKGQSFAISFFLKLARSVPGVIMKKGAGKSLSIIADKGGYGNLFPVPSIRFELATSACGCSARTSVDLADGKWHHVVTVRDASEEVTLVYIDGKYEGSGSGFLPEDIATPDPLFFGVSASGAGNEFAGSAAPLDGMIDEVSFYDGALTPGQVLELCRGLRP